MEGYTYPFFLLFLYSISVVSSGIPRSYLHFFNLYSSPMSSHGIQCSVLQWLALNTYNRLMIAPPHILPVPLFSSFNKTVHDVSFLSASPPLMRRWNRDVLLWKNAEVYRFYFMIIKFKVKFCILNFKWFFSYTYDLSLFFGIGGKYFVSDTLTPHKHEL